MLLMHTITMVTAGLFPQTRIHYCRENEQKFLSQGKQGPEAGLGPLRVPKMFL